MKFKINSKGRVTSWFANNASWRTRVHSGIDWVKGYGSNVFSDNAGFCYKLYRPGDLDSNWAAVYLLVPYEGEFMEVCMGHFSYVADVGETEVTEGQWVGREGNCGEVYSGGVRITADMQRAGDKRGSHVHENYRPVQRVKTKRSVKHYLLKGGKAYKDKEGFYYEIKYDTPTKGCIDPMQFEYKETPTVIRLKTIISVLTSIIGLYKIKNGK